MPVNFIQIVTNRNNWYLDAEAIDLARRVRQAPSVRPRESGPVRQAVGGGLWVVAASSPMAAAWGALRR